MSASRNGTKGTKMEKLKPCPFCGSRVSITYNSGEDAFAVWHTQIAPCFIEPLWISGDNAKTLSEAYAFWNRRAERSEDGET
jgi:hypothetical protein